MVDYLKNASSLAKKVKVSYTKNSIDFTEEQTGNRKAVSCLL